MASAGEDKMDSTLANWLCQTGLELRTAVSHCTGVSSCLGNMEVCTEYTNKRSNMRVRQVSYFHPPLIQMSGIITL